MAQSPRKSKLDTRARGVKDEITARSRRRRETQAALVEIDDRAAGRLRNDLVPELRIEHLDVGSVKVASRQLRGRDAAQAARIRASVKKFGVSRPILVNPNHEVIEGHGVLEAAKALGLEKIPCVIVGHLTAEEQRLFRLAINRLGESGSWDFKELRVELLELIDLGCDVADAGFELAEVDALLLDDDEVDEEPDPNASTALSGAPISRPGDVWRLGRHRLAQGDARAAESYQRLMLPGEEARMIYTDVPFNVPIGGHVTSNGDHREFACASGEMSREEFARFNRDWMNAGLPYLVDGGLLATYIDWRSVDLLIGCGREVGLEPINLIVWAKTNAGQGSLWRSQHELLPVLKKGSASHLNNVQLGKLGRWRSNVWTYPGASSMGSDARDGLAVHPTVKPRAMLADCLLDVSNRDDIVIDPFVGSGSTLLAAEATGRVCRAIEIDALYCDLVVRRWQAMTGEEAFREQDGASFAELERQAAETGAE